MDEKQRDGIIYKQLGALTKMAPAQPADLDLIRQHIQPGAEIAAEDVLIGSAKLAHDQYDRSSERFTRAYLERFAETIPGKSLMEGHDYSRKPSGRWFDANVQRDASGDYLSAKFYVNAKSPIAEDIRLGIAKDVSIGFKPDKLICDMCNQEVWGAKSDCSHWPGQEYDGKVATATYGGDASKAEALEGSLVWLGCQPGAQVMGQSSPLYQRKMALAAAAQTKGDDSMTELEEALAKIKQLEADLATSETYKKQAEKYEASLREQILHDTKVRTMATTKGDVKAADQDVEYATLLLKGASAEHLEAMATTLKTQVKALLTPVGQAEGAGHVPPPGEPPPAKKVGFGPQRRAMG